MNAHQLLVDAWGRIEDPTRWCGNGPSGVGGGNCAWLAFNLSYTSEPAGTDYAEYLKAEEALLLSLPHTWPTTGDFACILIGRFNDHPDTTHDDIRAFYMRAIASVAPEPDTSFLSNVKVEPERVTS